MFTSIYKRVKPKSTLFSYQTKIVREILAQRYLINASEMGTGKTIMALYAIVKSGLPAIIICPAFLAYTWKREIETHFEGVTCCIFPEKLDTEHIQICSYERVEKLIYTPTYQNAFIVFDEAHYLCNPKAQRTKNALRLLVGTDPKFVVLQTGTPLKNRVPEYWQLFSILSSLREDNFNKRFPNKWVFSNVFCESTEQFINGRMITKFVGVKAIDTLRQIHHTYARKIYLKDVIDLPEIQEQVIEFDDDYASKELEELLDKAFSTGQITSVKAQFAASKVYFTAKYIEEVLAEHEKVVVFSDHVKPLILLQGLLSKYENEIITGDVSIPARQPIVQKFQHGSIRIIFCTIKAAGVGITLTAANVAIFNDKSWVPAENIQAGGRINRIGQKRQCLIKYIARRGIDNMITRTLMNKERIINAVQG